MNAEASLPTRYVFVGSALIFLIGIATMVPVPFHPFSLVIVLPALLAGDHYVWFGASAGAFIGTLAFAGFGSYVVRTGRFMPIGSLVVFAVIAILSLAWAILGWEETTRHQGLARANVLVALALAPPICISLVTIALWHSLTVLRSIALHWAMFAWFSWSAFPWYGEMI